MRKEREEKERKEREEKAEREAREKLAAMSVSSPSSSSSHQQKTPGKRVNGSAQQPKRILTNTNKAQPAPVSAPVSAVPVSASSSTSGPVPPTPGPVPGPSRPPSQQQHPSQPHHHPHSQPQPILAQPQPRNQHLPPMPPHMPLQSQTPMFAIGSPPRMNYPQQPFNSFPGHSHMVPPQGRNPFPTPPGPPGMPPPGMGSMPQHMAPIGPPRRASMSVEASAPGPGPGLIGRPAPITPIAPIARPNAAGDHSGGSSPNRRSPSPTRGRPLGSSALVADDDEVVPKNYAPPRSAGWGGPPGVHPGPPGPTGVPITVATPAAIGAPPRGGGWGMAPGEAWQPGAPGLNGAFFGVPGRNGFATPPPHHTGH